MAALRHPRRDMRAQTLASPAAGAPAGLQAAYVRCHAMPRQTSPSTAARPRSPGAVCATRHYQRSGIRQPQQDARQIAVKVQRQKSADQSSSEPPLPSAWAEVFDLGEEPLLGNGAFAKIFRVVEQSTGKPFAMKVMRRSNFRMRGIEGQVDAEINAMQRCADNSCCQNVARLCGCVEENDNVYLRMELCACDLLRLSAAQPTGKFEEIDATCWCRQLLSGLRDLHSLGILHRDVKPENLLCAPDGALKIADFGWCADVRDSPSSLAGTFHYMAPEILGQRGVQTEAVDVWSAGVTILQLVTGIQLLMTYLGPGATALTHTDPHQATKVKTSRLLSEIAKSCPPREDARPAGTSRACWDFLRCMLQPEVQLRALVPEALSHAWLAGGLEAEVTLPETPKEKTESPACQDVVEASPAALQPQASPQAAPSSPQLADSAVPVLSAEPAAPLVLPAGSVAPTPEVPALPLPAWPAEQRQPAPAVSVPAPCHSPAAPAPSALVSAASAVADRLLQTRGNPVITARPDKARSVALAATVPAIRVVQGAISERVPLHQVPTPARAISPHRCRRGDKVPQDSVPRSASPLLSGRSAPMVTLDERHFDVERRPTTTADRAHATAVQNPVLIECEIRMASMLKRLQGPETGRASIDHLAEDGFTHPQDRQNSARLIRRHVAPGGEAQKADKVRDVVAADRTVTACPRRRPEPHSAGAVRDAGCAGAGDNLGGFVALDLAKVMHQPRSRSPRAGCENDLSSVNAFPISPALGLKFQDVKAFRRVQRGNAPPPVRAWTSVLHGQPCWQAGSLGQMLTRVSPERCHATPRPFVSMGTTASPKQGFRDITAVRNSPTSIFIHAT